VKTKIASRLYPGAAIAASAARRSIR
jgi:hypothetical protein